MTAFLMYDPRPVYLTLTGEVAAGGSLQFFAAGTTTPQDVYGDSGLTVNNGSTLTLGSDGRTSVEVWGDASLSYRVRLYDSSGALVFDQDDVAGSSGGGSTTIPTLGTGQFLTNDGSQLLWADIRQLPDPTGQAGKVLSTDGTNFTWISKPADGSNADISASPALATFGSGTGDKYCIQVGSATAPATGTHTTSKQVTFPTAFKSVATAIPIPRSASVAQSSYHLIPATLYLSTIGFTASFDVNAYSATDGNITSDCPFDWIAFGTIAA